MAASEKEEFEFRARAEREAGGYSSVPGGKTAPVETASEPGMLEKLAGGAEAALALGTGATTGALGAAAGGAGGAIESIVKGQYGTPEGVETAAKRARAGAESLTYQPRTAAGRKALESTGKAIESTGIQGVNPALALPAVPGIQTAGRAARGAAAKTGEVVADTAGKVANAVTPKVAPDVQALASKAQALGIDLRPDMLTDNRIVKMMGEALEKVPLSGSKAEQRQQAFNRALGALVGADEKAKKLTPDVFDRAMTQSGEKIGALTEKTAVPLTPEFQQTLGAFVEEAGKFETADVAKIVTNYVKELEGKAANGAIPGEALRKLNTKIGTQARNTGNGDLKHALGELQEHIHDAVAAQLSGEDLAALQAARKQYAIGKALEPLVAKSETGDMSPAGLMSAVTNDKDGKSRMARNRGGELGDLARIGQMFLKEPKSSGTSERALAYGLLGGTGLASVPVATGVYGGANLYNRLGPKLAKRMTRLSEGQLPAVPQ